VIVLEVAVNVLLVPAAIKLPELSRVDIMKPDVVAWVVFGLKRPLVIWNWTSVDAATALEKALLIMMHLVAEL
jgi:hypothetical protein